jgi:hypothetical protein
MEASAGIVVLVLLMRKMVLRSTRSTRGTGTSMVSSRVMRVDMEVVPMVGLALAMMRLSRMAVMRLMMAMVRLTVAVMRVVVSRVIVVIVVVVLMVVVAAAAARARWSSINHESDCQILASSLTPSENLLDERLLVDLGPAGFLPLNERPQLVGEEALLEHMVGDMGQTVVRSGKVSQLDALRNDLGIMPSVQVDVAEPEDAGEVLNYEFQGGLGRNADTVLQQLLDNLTGLDTLAVLALPPGAWSVPRLNVPLEEHVVKHVLEVDEPRILELELNELSGRWEVMTRGEVVGNPELRASHVDEVNMSRFEVCGHGGLG